MGKETSIGWCDHTFNPWQGCSKVSEACKYCYAEAMDHRYHAGDPHWGIRAPRKFFSDDHWKGPMRWHRAAERAGQRRRVFCASMADVFEDREDLLEHRARLWQLIAGTPMLDWLLLTKRPENIEAMLPKMSYQTINGHRLSWHNGLGGPWSNVWLGTTAEDQDQLERRLLHLLPVRAAVHFLSYEPALGALDLHRVRVPGTEKHYSALEVQRDGNFFEAPAQLDWVIAGCESGPHARPYEVVWFRKVRDQCAESGTAFFLKQATDVAEIVPGQGIITRIGVGPGSTIKGKANRASLIEAPELDGVQHLQWPRNRAGEDMRA